MAGVEAGAGRRVVIGAELADQPDPTRHHRIAFEDGEYRIDLVYGSRSEADRNSARGILIESAQDEGLRITDFKEC